MNEDSVAAVLQLDVVAGKASGFRISVDERLVFGRQADGPGRLADDPELSRHHAEISRQPAGVYLITDLSSTNGTFVNGDRIAAPATLSVGDTIEVGATTMVVRAVPSRAASPTGPVDVRAATVTVDIPAAMRAPAAEPAAVAQPPQPAPALELRLTFDPDRAEAEIALTDGSEPVRLRLRDGRWQRDDMGS